MISLGEYVYEKPNFNDFLSYVSKYEDLPGQVNKKYKGECPLYWALDGELGEVAAWLLDNGAEANANSVYAAAQRGFFDVLKRLIEMGAPYEEYFAVGGFPPLIAACCESSKYYRGDLEVHKTVDGKKVLVTDQDEIDKIAGKDRYAGFGKIVPYLLEKGANPNLLTQNKDGLTALHWCAHKGGAHLAKMLLDAKADPNLKSNDGLIPLHYAARGDWKNEEARLLIDHGSDINAQENYGFTPLHEAAENKSENVLRMLLEAGADTTIGITQGFSPYTLGDTAIDVAKKKRFNKISAIFKEYSS